VGGLQKLTTARIDSAVPARRSPPPLLEFKLAHALARDAVHEALDEARSKPTSLRWGCR